MSTTRKAFAEADCKPLHSNLVRLPSEERIYRFRCVEGWSMIVPWNGFSLGCLLAKAKPTSRAKFVEFVSLKRPSEMIGQRSNHLDWPYREALRMDEAMHPLTMAVTGVWRAWPETFAVIVLLSSRLWLFLSKLKRESQRNSYQKRDSDIKKT